MWTNINFYIQFDAYIVAIFVEYIMHCEFYAESYTFIKI